MGSAGSASAAGCDRSVAGATAAGLPTAWHLNPSTGEIEDASLLLDPPALRGNPFDGVWAPLALTFYANPSGRGCRLSNHGHTVAYPAQTNVYDVRIRPIVSINARRPFGTVYVGVENTGSTPRSFDFIFDGELGTDGHETIQRTSSGDTVVAPPDAWVVLCADYDVDGCRDQSGPAERGRQPEEGLVWERQGHKRESADWLEGPEGQTPPGGNGFDDTDMKFEHITLAPGHAKAFLAVAVIARNIRGALRVTKEVARTPGRSGVFSGLSRAQRARIQNW